MLAGLPAATLSPFQRVLNAAARLMLDLKPRDHHNYIPPFTSCIGYTHWTTKSTGCASQDINLSRTRLHLRPSHTGRRHAITLVLARLQQRQPLSSTDGAVIWRPGRSFSVAALRARNQLPTELKLMCSSTTTFKRHLKTDLFNSAYTSHWQIDYGMRHRALTVGGILPQMLLLLSQCHCYCYTAVI